MFLAFQHQKCSKQNLFLAFQCQKCSKHIMFLPYQHQKCFKHIMFLPFRHQTRPKHSMFRPFLHQKYSKHTMFLPFRHQKCSKHNMFLPFRHQRGPVKEKHALGEKPCELGWTRWSQSGLHPEIPPHNLPLLHPSMLSLASLVAGMFSPSGARRGSRSAGSIMLSPKRGARSEQKSCSRRSTGLILSGDNSLA